MNDFLTDNKLIDLQNKISNQRDSSLFIKFFSSKKDKTNKLIEKISSNFISQYEKVLPVYLFHFRYYLIL